MKLNKYSKMIFNFFDENHLKLYNLAKKVMKNYYSIPIDIDDLISLVIYKFNTIEMEEMFYFSPQKMNAEQFIMSKAKYIMFDLCNFYANKNHAILNNYVDYNDEYLKENLQCNQDYYLCNNDDEVINSLTKQEFELLYDLKVKKQKRKDVARLYNLSLYRLKMLEIEIISKIKKQLS